MDQQQRLDAKSGLFPQSMLETLLAHEVASARRYPSPISLIYFALRFPGILPRKSSKARRC